MDDRPKLCFGSVVCSCVVLCFFLCLVAYYTPLCYCFESGKIPPLCFCSWSSFLPLFVALFLSLPPSVIPPVLGRSPDLFFFPPVLGLLFSQFPQFFFSLSPLSVPLVTFRSLAFISREQSVSSNH